MPTTATRPHVNPAAYLRIAFDALNWSGWTFEAAMQHATRRQIIEFIANHYPQKMETIVPIARIEQLANKAAQHSRQAAEAQPYPAHTSAAKLFVLFFDVEQKRLQTLTQQALSATKEIASVKYEAQAAAAVKALITVNDACPYPFDSAAGIAFKAEFLRIREAQATEASP